MGWEELDGIKGGGNGSKGLGERQRRSGVLEKQIDKKRKGKKQRK